MTNERTFVCTLCEHVHHVADEMIEVPGVCGWCADERPCRSGERPDRVPWTG